MAEASLNCKTNKLIKKKHLLKVHDVGLNANTRLFRKPVLKSTYIYIIPSVLKKCDSHLYQLPVLPSHCQFKKTWTVERFSAVEFWSAVAM